MQIINIKIKHRVNFSCALSAYKKTNKCSCCNTKIIDKSIDIQYRNNLSDQKDICSICLEETCTQLKCGHYFHKECINISAKYSDKCPYCRKYLL